MPSAGLYTSWTTLVTSGEAHALQRSVSCLVGAAWHLGFSIRPLLQDDRAALRLRPAWRGKIYLCENSLVGYQVVKSTHCFESRATASTSEGPTSLASPIGQTLSGRLLMEGLLADVRPPSTAHKMGTFSPAGLWSICNLCGAQLSRALNFAASEAPAFFQASPGFLSPS